ncbi:nucleoside-diphosphate-sugar epimerase [Pararhizobium capsulatum DSM 1112]|uniref:Nucleoside-diphosphate-sugar epimerase n=1 Tax=Pararhizobium capsulatum DSM 1112 TaxID=1121113 RepID=A0ABU0BV37_9HYPH|nr:D-erythronate dehydrogenase [Pararhizobium capsulatum]MDQ0322111.1 nucleoside-diphosphate-sugar epimerase [Pararhizobium capsulatum DSM 1112]
MHILVVGAAGMIGGKLLDRIAGQLDVLGEPIEALTIVDVIEPIPPAALSDIANCGQVDLVVPGAAETLIAARPDVIFHLAAVVSGEAESDFDKGYRVNMDGTRALFEAIRKEGQKAPYVPRLVFASSVAVFGAPFPERIGDEFFTTPLTSYGTQKAIAELLLADYSRRGIFDGIGIRLPTICIRPGAPNKAASSFFSNILREPLVGKEAILPVDVNVRHWFASPRSAVGFFVHAARLDLSLLGTRRNLMMPGLCAMVGEQLAALERVAGARATALIRRQPDPVVQKIVSGWPSDFDTERARALGFAAETSFDDIIRIHIEDELDGMFGG